MCAMGEPSASVDYIDTIIVGGGPASLTLSYLLHGHVAAYQPARPHSDPIIHRALTSLPSRISHDGHTAHPISTIPLKAYVHLASSIRYSAQALPINTLLDTLIRPNADTDPDPISCIDWIHDSTRVVNHLVVTDEATAGGQWASSAFSPAGDGDERARSDDIGTLSYAEQLNLPGYSYGDFYYDTHGEMMSAFERPTKKEIAEYLACYPTATNIDRAIMTHSRVTYVERLNDRTLGSLRSDDLHLHPKAAFLATVHISPPNRPPFARQIICRHLVLASGTFTHPLLPPPLLSPLARLSRNPWSRLGTPRQPTLIVGSGFSAADAIIASPVDQPVLHIFKWDPENRPSPLKGCHHQAYPEYAGVYRRMKMAAIQTIGSGKHAKMTSPLSTRKRERNPFEKMRDWDNLYEGLPNAEILSVETSFSDWSDGQRCSHKRRTPDVERDGIQAIVRIKLQSGEIVERAVSHLRYVVGRRGSLDYLSDALRSEVLRNTVTDEAAWVSSEHLGERAAEKRSHRATMAVNPIQQRSSTKDIITGNTLRSRLVSEQDGSCNLEVAPEVFVIGSLTGDSLIRHALGGCVWTASEIIQRQGWNSRHFESYPVAPQRIVGSFQSTKDCQRRYANGANSQFPGIVRSSTGLGIADAYIASLSANDGVDQDDVGVDRNVPSNSSSRLCWKTNGTSDKMPGLQHPDLHIDRKEVARRSREILDEG